MKLNEIAKRRTSYYFVILAIFLLASFLILSFMPMDIEMEDTWSDSGYLKVGHHLTIENRDNRLTLLDSKDVLSANGLYYASWAMGDTQPFENSDGEVTDLYDAQLYLCLEESSSGEGAQASMEKWLDTAKGSYEILMEADVSCNGQAYRLITYRFSSKDTPYDRGVSAYGTCGSNAICIELVCAQSFTEDPRNILLDFLNSCAYDNP